MYDRTNFLLLAEFYASQQLKILPEEMSVKPSQEYWEGREDERVLLSRELLTYLKEDTVPFETLTTLVESWGEDRNLIEGSFGQALNQLGKTKEEVKEVKKELKALIADPESIPDPTELKLELGDVLVTLVLVAANADVDLVECLEMAYSKIKSRTGKLVDGVFVKDE